MASIKVKFHPSTVAGHRGSIYYQISHGGRVRQLSSDYKVFPSEWDKDRSMVTIPQNNERHRDIIQILSIREGILLDIRRLIRIDRELNIKGLSYTVDDVIDEFHRFTREYSLFNFMECQIVKLRESYRIRTSETYQSALNSFRKFRRDKDVMLDGLTPEIMEAYEAWNRQRGIIPNTISFYNRILRAVYNRAVENGKIDNTHPFRHVYTGVDKTVKRALPLSIIKKIKSLDLSSAPSLEFARDMFVLSFMLRGMSFIDMSYLRKSDLANGYLTYRRRKTGQKLTIKWNKEMQRLLDKYPENKTEYLLPIIRYPGRNERYVYRNVGYNINRNLKIVARMIGLTTPLTLYVARHSWASAARAKGIPLAIISEGMGHDSEATTLIYLTSLDTSAVDKANALILQGLS